MFLNRGWIEPDDHFVFFDVFAVFDYPENRRAARDLALDGDVVGVVTSPTGAVIRDIVNVLSRRFKPFHLVLSPVRVQGESAAAEIAQAIDDFKAERFVKPGCVSLPLEIGKVTVNARHDPDVASVSGNDHATIGEEGESGRPEPNAVRIPGIASWQTEFVEGIGLVVGA